MAARGRVEFFYRANVGDVAKAEQYLVHSSQRLEGALRNVARTQSTMHSQFNRLFRGVGAGVAAYASVATVMNTVNQAVGSLGETLQNRYDFEKTMTPLLALGDNSKGIQMIQKTKREILDLSNAYGVARDDIADFIFWSQSSGSGIEMKTLVDLQKESLELAEAAGGTPMTAVNLLTKAYRVYGREIANVNQIQNKIFKIQELGATSFDEMATLLPNMLPAAEKVGLSFDEAGALFITATQMQGRNEIATTGVRNFVLSLVEAEKKGFRLTGDLYEKLEQLRDLSAQDIMALAGRESFAVISALADKVDEIRVNAEALKNIAGDPVRGILQERLQDPANVDARIKGSLEQMIPNIYIDPSYRMKGIQEIDLSADYVKLGMRAGHPEWFASLFDSGFMRAGLNMYDIVSGGGYARKGMDIHRQTLVDAGKTDEAEAVAKRQDKILESTTKGLTLDRTRQVRQEGADLERELTGIMIGNVMDWLTAIPKAVQERWWDFRTKYDAFLPSSPIPGGRSHLIESARWRRQLFEEEPWRRPSSPTAAFINTLFSKDAVDAIFSAGNSMPGGMSPSEAVKMEIAARRDKEEKPTKSTEALTVEEARRMQEFISREQAYAQSISRGKGSKFKDGEIVVYNNAVRGALHNAMIPGLLMQDFGGEDRLRQLLGPNIKDWDEAIEQALQPSILRGSGWKSALGALRSQKRRESEWVKVGDTDTTPLPVTEAEQMYADLSNELWYADRLGRGTRKGMTMVNGAVQRYERLQPGEEYAQHIPERFMAKYGTERTMQMLGDDPVQWLQRLQAIIAGDIPQYAATSAGSGSGAAAAARITEVSDKTVAAKLDDLNANVRILIDATKGKGETRGTPTPSGTSATRGTKEVVGARG